MTKKALHQDIFREIRKTRSRFLSIFVLSALAVAFLAGLRTTAPDMEVTADHYLDDQNMMDIQIMATLGITEEDVSALAQRPGVLTAEGSYTVDGLVSGGDNDLVVKVLSISKSGMNAPELLRGRMPENAGECLVEESMLDSLGTDLGSTITIDTGTGDYEGALSQSTFTVVGTCQSPLYLSLQRGTSTLGTGAVSCFVLLPEDAFVMDSYTEAYLTLEGAKELNAYSDAYENLTDTWLDDNEAFGEERAALRAEEIRSDAEAELADAQQEYDDAEAEVNQELADAEAELSDARQELDDGWKEYQDGVQELEDQLAEGRQELSDAEQELSDAYVELTDGEAEYQDGLADYEEGLQKYNDGYQEFMDAKAEYDEGYRDWMDGKTEYDEGYQEWLDGRAELDDGWAEYYDGLEEYEDGKKQLEKASAQLDDAWDEIQAGRAELDAGWDEYYAGVAEFEAQLPGLEAQLSQLESQLTTAQAGLEAAQQGKAQAEAGLAQAQAMLDQAEEALAQLEQSGTATEEELAAAQQAVSMAQAGVETAQGYVDQAAASVAEAEAGIATIQGYIDQINTGITQGRQELADAKQQLLDGEEEYEDGLREYEDGVDEYNAGRQELREAKEQLDEALTELEDGEAELAEGKAELDDAKVELDDGWAELMDGKAQLDEAEAELIDGKVELDDAKAQLADARKELDDGWAEYNQGLIDLEDGRQTLKEEEADARSELADAYQELTDGEAEYADGLKEYEDGKAEAEEELSDARSELRDARRTIDELDDGEWYLLSRKANAGFVGYQQDAERMGNLAAVFPLLFFLVAALVCLTTMTRMVEEQRSQIGCLSALGYSKVDIAKKYVGYGLLASLSGSLVGLVVGCTLIPFVIITAWRIMYNIPGLVFAPQPVIYLLSVLAAVACNTVAVLAAAINALRSTPATLMRPRAPKAGKRVLLERIRPIWSRLSFIHKVTVRNLFRYKKRFWMTAIGIAGCTALIVTGFGLRDSLLNIMNIQYDEIYHYQAQAALESHYADDEFQEVVDQLNADERVTQSLPCMQNSATLESDSRSIDGYFTVVENADELDEFVTLRTRLDHTPVSLTDEGAVLTEKASELLDVGIGDTITVVSGDLRGEVTITAITENYIQHYIYLTDACYERVFGEAAKDNSILLTFSENTLEIADAVTADLISLDGVTSVTRIESIRETLTSSMESVDSAVVLVIVCAAALAFVVLYNLTNINITERMRELATLKVLGFNDREMGAYIYRENVMLTIFGVALGLVLGKFLHQWLVLTVEIDMVMFGRSAQPMSYVYAVGLTVLFSLLVNLWANRKLQSIDMVESLKSVE